MTAAHAHDVMHGLPDEYLGHMEGLRAKEIRFPRCRACGKFHWYPMKRCPHCLGVDFDWNTITGEATLHSWTVVRRAFSADFAEAVPYIVGLVEFAQVPGIRLITNIVGTQPEGLEFGMAVESLFETRDSALPRVNFRPLRKAVQ